MTNKTIIKTVAVAFLAGALKHIRAEMEFQLESTVLPETLAETQAALLRLKAMGKAGSLQRRASQAA